MSVAAVQLERPVDGLEHVAHRDLGARARQRDAAAGAPRRMQHAGVHQALDDLGEVAFGQALGGGDVVRLHDGARLAQGELVDGADGVVGLCGEPHRSSLWTNRAYLSSWRRCAVESGARQTSS